MVATNTQSGSGAMIENYLITLIYILFNALIALTILAVALIVALAIVLSKQQ